MVKKARRYLGLFLARMVSLSCMPSVAWADGDVFRADCTVDTEDAL